MLRSTSQLQRSLRISQLYRSITNANLERSESGLKHLNDLPTAKKFLGLVDLEILRWPITKFHKLLEKKSKINLETYRFSSNILKCQNNRRANK